ncbi:hypothetical protein Rhe02_54270 [Rhizocola hellebori]|uniref:AAA domain-containing protein n=1 Tax=Rhizocola hellebori TaxID=1392758 RepID=A0A8J3VI93_9ACTN|nr:hypothetical protein [Rhizocola hellebori]GIH07360.1 hypothetical protein Rhe02_54270 [Rhizocola hellebori]
MTTLKTRPPTGRIPWPLILVEGPEKAGKSWLLAELSASDKVGQTYWLDLGEGAADEYGAIPGARYLVLEHDGTWRSILGQVEAVRAEAERVAKLGEPPVVLGIDSSTAEWDLHKDWAQGKAKDRLKRNGKGVAADVEVTVSMDLWNEATARHRRLMTILMTFPGIVVVTARGKDVAAMDGNGKPIANTKEYKVEGQKNLAFDCSVWIRVSREHPPLVVGARSVHAGVRPGVDRPRPMPGLTLERVIFDILKCEPATAHVRDLVNPQGEEGPEPQQLGKRQMEELMALLEKAELNSKELALPYINEAIKPESVEKTAQLSVDQAEQVLVKLRKYVAQLEPATDKASAVTE